jgi:hypothetical protein
MTYYTDELATSGALLCDNELVAYILADLEEDYNPVFTAIVARVDPVSPSDFYAHLLSFKQHTHLPVHAPLPSSSSAMTATRGRGFVGHDAGGSDRGHGRGCGNGRTSRSHGRSSGDSRPQCQVCLKF